VRSHNLSIAQLDQVSQALIVSRLRHALRAWSGLLTTKLISTPCLKNWTTDTLLACVQTKRHQVENLLQF